jgi:uncharacterized protein YqjF (DUF2071 family)
MSDPLPLEERLAPRHRPVGSPIGYHRWHDLLFIHWRVPASLLRPVVPAGLEIDTWGGDAWLGLVAFDMTGVRPWWSPCVPGVSAFHETNLRTYVHVSGRGPGVYFISLEAARSLAVRIARWRWNLPYYRAHMAIQRQGARICYTSRRLWPEPRGAETNLEAEIGDWLADGGQAQPGTLEFFLAERYLLYTASRKGGLLSGQVHHTPYPLRTARLVRCDETLARAAGIACGPEQAKPCHVMFSPGVSVQIFALRPVGAGASAGSRQLVRPGGVA